MSEQVELSIMVRSFQLSDQNFLFNAWLRSYRAYTAYTPNVVYFPCMRDQIAAIMQRPQARCVVACDEDKPDFIYGFCVADEPGDTDIYYPLLVHYMFVKLAYRNLGIAKQMLQEFSWNRKRAIHCSFWTRFCKDHAQRLHLFHNEFAIRGFNHGREYPYQSGNLPDVEEPTGHAGNDLVL